MKPKSLQQKKGKDERDTIWLLTDTCMWEKNKQEGTRAPHAIQVIDTKTGQSRFIRSGSHIKFVDGQISPVFSQEEYNQLTTPSKSKS